MHVIAAKAVCFKEAPVTTLRCTSRESLIMPRRCARG